MGVLNDYDATPASNNAAPPDGAPENTTLLGDVNNIDRELMARLKQNLEDESARNTVAGTANAITLTASATHTAYYNGMRLMFVAGSTNTGATTINVNSLGARSIRTIKGEALSGGEWEAGDYVSIIYDSANSRFVLIFPFGQFRVRDETGVSSITFAQVRDVTGNWKDVATVAPLHSTTSGAVTIDEQDVHRHLVFTSSGSVLFANDSDIPTDAIGYIRNRSGAVLALQAGTGVTIRFFRGSSVTTAVSGGSPSFLDLNNGGFCTWQKTGATDYDVWGSDFS